MKVSELTGATLDYWVARAEGMKEGRTNYVGYSKSWAVGGPLIEKHKVEIVYNWNYEEPDWSAGMNSHSDKLILVEGGETPLIAICRAVVRSVFGDEVEDL